MEKGPPKADYKAASVHSTLPVSRKQLQCIYEIKWKISLFTKGN